MEIAWRLYGDCVESDTLYGDLVVKLVWKLFGYLMYHGFSKETRDNFL